MSDIMTPMKRLKFYIEGLKETTNQKFNHVVLNKAAPGYGYYYQKKGVKNDFVLLFNERGGLRSFGLSFSYIGLEESEQRVSYSYKEKSTDNTFKEEYAEYSAELTIMEFKEIMKKVLVVIHNKDFDSSFIIKELNSVFLPDRLDFKKETERYSNIIAVKLEDKKTTLNIDKFKKDVKVSTKLLNKAIVLINNELENYPEFKRLKEIDKEIADLKLKVATKKESLLKENNVELLAARVKDCNRLLKKAEKDLATFEALELNNVPFMIRRNVKLK